MFKVCTVFIASLFLVPIALADPCEADLPSKAGTVFTGKVKYIVDGDGICVGTSSDKNTWIEVRLVDFNAPELSTPEGKLAKKQMKKLAMGKRAQCVTKRGRTGRTTSWDRVHASCMIEGASLASLLREAGVPEGGN